MVSRLKTLCVLKAKNTHKVRYYDPRRTIATSVRVEDGEIPLVSVKIDRPIPKNKIFDVMREIKKLKLKAPIRSGTILISKVAGTEANVIATKTVERVK